MNAANGPLATIGGPFAYRRLPAEKRERISV
jgi:hypothetical protein